MLYCTLVTYTHAHKSTQHCTQLLQVVQQLLSLLNPASLADEGIHGALAQAAYYALKHRRQAALPPLLLLLGPDHADADWFQVTAGSRPSRDALVPAGRQVLENRVGHIKLQPAHDCVCSEAVLCCGLQPV
jgi:hypothetical protein